MDRSIHRSILGCFVCRVDAVLLDICVLNSDGDIKYCKDNVLNLSL